MKLINFAIDIALISGINSIGFLCIVL